MSSPRIRAEHIPALYRLAKSRNISMTVLVDEALSTLLARPEARAAIAAVAIPPKHPIVRQDTATPARRRAAGRSSAGQETDQR